MLQDDRNKRLFLNHENPNRDNQQHGIKRQGGSGLANVAQAPWTGYCMPLPSF